MDIVSPEKRSLIMSRIKGKDTKPEMVVRRLAHAMGLRYRLHQRHLPGSPDMVFPRHRRVVFVHGCFWHRHVGCKYAYSPKTNVEKWRIKFESNVQRDASAISTLEQLGWKVLVIWECETYFLPQLTSTLISFFDLEDD